MGTAATPLGERMLFAALVEIIIHQMEHFKEIHTQLSWLRSFLSVLSFLLPLSSRLPGGSRGTLILSTVESVCTSIYTHIGGIYLRIPSVNHNLLTSVMFPMNIVLCALAFNVSIWLLVSVRIFGVCVCVCLYLSVFHCRVDLSFPGFVPD